MAQDFGVNQGLVEEMFLRWAGNPSSVDEAWRRFFEGLEPSELPQLTSAGTIAAPVEAKKSNGHGQIPASAPVPKGTELSGVYKLPPTAEDIPFVERRAEPRTTAFPPSAEVMTATELQARVAALVNAYRVRGHLYANLDPLGLAEGPDASELFLERYGLAHVDQDTLFSTGDLAGPPTATLREILERLTDTYTRSIGVEFTFLEDREARTWLQEAMDSTRNRIELSREEQLRILTKLTDAEIFEQFLHT